jgi:hypothetical protein
MAVVDTFNGILSEMDDKVSLSSAKRDLNRIEDLLKVSL